MTELVIFPDIEDFVTTWLRGRLASLGYDVVVATRVPSPRPSTFVRVTRVGGTAHTVITDAATMFVESFAEREAEAVTLAQLARGLLRSMPGRVDENIVYRVDEAGGPNNFPEPLTSGIRYVQTFVIHARGARSDAFDPN